MAQKEEYCPWGKEASLMHCTGLKWGTRGEQEAEVAKNKRVTQKNTIRLEPRIVPWNSRPVDLLNLKTTVSRILRFNIVDSWIPN